MSRALFVLLLVAVILAAIFGLRSCGQVVQGPKLSFKRAAVAAIVVDTLPKDVDTVYLTKVETRVVIRKLYVPSVAPDSDGLKKFSLKDKDVTIVAKLDSVDGKETLRLDSVDFVNYQDITLARNKGGTYVSVLNSNRYFSNANVSSLYVPDAKPSRWSVGLQAGLFVTPAGLQPGIGCGVGFRIK